jgi:hypothetical protein
MGMAMITSYPQDWKEARRLRAFNLAQQGWKQCEMDVLQEFRITKMFAVDERRHAAIPVLKVPTRAAAGSSPPRPPHAACEGEEQEALRVHALHEVRHAARERVGLAGAGLGEDQQGRSPKQVAARWRGFSFSNWARACTGPDYRALLYILQFYVECRLP